MIMILRSQIASIGDRFSARHIGRPLLWESEALIWLRVSDPTEQMSFSLFRLQKILNASQTWSLASEVVAISPQRRVRGVSGNQARQKAGLRCLRYDIKPGLYQSALLYHGITATRYACMPSMVAASAFSRVELDGMSISSVERFRGIVHFRAIRLTEDRDGQGWPPQAASSGILFDPYVSAMTILLTFTVTALPAHQTRALRLFRPCHVSSTRVLLYQPAQNHIFSRGIFQEADSSRTIAPRNEKATHERPF